MLKVFDENSLYLTFVHFKIWIFVTWGSRFLTSPKARSLLVAELHISMHISHVRFALFARKRTWFRHVDAVLCRQVEWVWMTRREWRSRRNWPTSIPSCATCRTSSRHNTCTLDASSYLFLVILWILWQTVRFMVILDLCIVNLVHRMYPHFA